MSKKKVSLKDFSHKPGRLVDIDGSGFLPLPPPYDKLDLEPKIKELSEEAQKKYECDLDGFTGYKLPRPETEEEKRKLIEKFLKGLKKLFDSENNWTFQQILFLTMEFCAKCQTCSAACPIYNESGKEDIYRPTFRSDILRRLYKKYVKTGGKFFAKVSGNDIDVTWTMLARLMELSYRCTICRRCAQTCPIGVDNALVTREIRKIFSQELGITVAPLHEKGSVQQLRVGSSTGMSAEPFLDNIEFLEEEVEERTGMKFKWPMDVAGADILLMHNAGEFLAWPENPEAFAIIMEVAGLSWTLSSEALGYDSVNYGVWYDDVQFAKVALKHAQAAKKLGVKKIVLGECGHAHKALTVIADRVLVGDLNIPRESSMTLLRELIQSGRIKVDPSRNDDIMTTMHDPCNLVRLMGVVKPQRDVLKAVCNNFREMAPYGVENYCCGGGSGFAITQDLNFPSFRENLSGRAKMRQILDVFQDVIGPEQKKYVCAPCSNCKGAIRDMFASYDVFDKCNILYGGLVELVVNAMVDIDKPFLEWEWH
ncbi:MAG: (Fe-S)-binding protein [candidate division Zixibacteria bacterium]|nr:(Fe-S)-binding protein [candidate division Zixibacteria bacterium]